jgi:flagellar basal body-associated protein FliL
MVDEHQSSVPKGSKSKKTILIAVLAVIVVAVVLIAVVMMPGSSKSNALVKGDPSESILSASDLGSGWSVRNEYANQTDNYQLEDAVAAGYILFNKTNESNGLMYVVKIQFVLFPSVDVAKASYDNNTVEMMNMTLSYSNQKNVTVGDGGHIGDVNRSMAGHDGKLLMVLEKNVMFLVEYGLMSADAPAVTEAMALDIANKQISKL